MPCLRPALLAALLVTLAAAIAGCRAAPADPLPEHETFTLQSQQLGELRRLNVYVPRAYRDDDTTRWPVLYMPDGGIAEDFPHIVQTVEQLIADGTIPPMLVVGIENTERRRDLTGPTAVASDREVAPRVGGSAAFRAFVRDELIPAVERRYRCNSQRAIVGESLAGLFVVETLLLEPLLFDRYIAISPSLWWNDRALVRQAAQCLDGMPPRPTRLFLASADEADIVPNVAELASLLAAHAQPSLAWRCEPMPGEQHHTIFRAAKQRAFAYALAP